MEERLWSMVLLFSLRYQGLNKFKNKKKTRKKKVKTDVSKIISPSWKSWILPWLESSSGTMSISGSCFHFYLWSSPVPGFSCISPSAKLSLFAKHHTSPTNNATNSGYETSGEGLEGPPGSCFHRTRNNMAAHIHVPLGNMHILIFRLFGQNYVPGLVLLCFFTAQGTIS